jgi:DNA-binding FadR family transcriptional regulator
MTLELVDAVKRHEPDKARLAMETYIARRHQDIKKIL